jgi:hypothetical protein
MKRQPFAVMIFCIAISSVAICADAGGKAAPNSTDNYTVSIHRQTERHDKYVSAWSDVERACREQLQYAFYAGRAVSDQQWLT